MAIGDAYSNPAAYRAVFGLNDPSKDPQITTDLLAVSRYIERCLDRDESGFNKDAAAVSRVFYPRGFHIGNAEAENPWRGVRMGRVLDLAGAELAAVPTSVKIDSSRVGNFTDASVTTLVNPDVTTGITGGDYQLWPLNRDKGPESAPWTQLFIPTWSTQTGWPPGAMVQVTAIYGWPAVPQAIVDACIQLTGIWRLESPRATARVPESMDQAFAMSPKAKGIIEDLKSAYTRSRLYA